MINSKIIYLLLITIFFISCKKKEQDSVLGLDVQPETDLVGITITDTSNVWIHTQKVDSVRSYNDQYKFLGSNQDPIFGRTDASIYTNFSITNNLSNINFGANPVLDSAEIIILYTGSYTGDTTTALNFQVYTLNEKIQPSTDYNSKSTLKKSSTQLCNLNGKIKARGENLYLIIPLDKTFAEYILQTSSNLINNTVFQNAYKGFYLTTENTILGAPKSGAILRLDLDDVNSGINLYYHTDGSTDTKGELYHFSFSGSDALRFNNIKHDYVGGATNDLYFQLSGDSLKSNNNVYLNTFGGTRLRVYLPYMQNFMDSQNVSISRAELILSVDEMASMYDANYSYPSSLALIGCGEDNSEQLVYDQLDAADFVKYNGNYDATNKCYRFNIARQMQKIITGKVKNYGFYLVNAMPNISYTARRDNRYQRLVFGGRENINFKPKFKVTYVKFPYDK